MKNTPFILSGLLPRQLKRSARKILRFRRPKVGARPGELSLSKSGRSTEVEVIVYAPNLHETNPENWHDKVGQAGPVVWIDLRNLTDETVIKQIAKTVDIPHFMLEDMVNVPQRVGANCQSGHLLMVTRMLHEKKEHTFFEQVSIYSYKNVVVTFQEETGDVFESIRTRLHNPAGLLRNGNAIQLAYGLLDTIIDAYFPYFENLADRTQILEQLALTKPNPALLPHLIEIRNEVVRARRAILPHRDLVGELLRQPGPPLADDIVEHLKDIQDHAVQANETTELLREMTSTLLNLYLSAMAHRTNEKMKVLTIMATIFIPLTFITGLYGMNFENMPELHTRWGYPLVWLAMILVSCGLLFYFYTKGWFGEQKSEYSKIISALYEAKANENKSSN